MSSQFVRGSTRFEAPAVLTVTKNVEAELSCERDRPSEVLFVDLDNTLIDSDSLHEVLLRLIRTQPWLVCWLPFWLLRGRAGFKEEISKRVALDPGSMPVRQSIIGVIEDAQAAGRAVVLATAANFRIAESVAARVGLFDAVLASTPEKNLKGSNKLEAMKAYADGREFDYIGDSRSDLPIWQASRKAILVNPQRGVLKDLPKNKPNEVIQDKAAVTIADLFRLMRIHQWSKNCLIIAPLILSHSFADANSVLRAALAFLVFGLCASATYIWNDLFDLPSDRAHASKRLRPIASGKVSIPQSLIVSVILILAAFSLCAYFLGPFSVLMLLGYVALTLTYSVYLKRKLLVDVITLAGFYAYRILFGAVAIAVAVSPWLLAFSFFFFLSLAFVKRYSEISEASTARKEQVSGRGYRICDLDMIRSFGVSTGNTAVLILALYLNSDLVREIYLAPGWLWFLCVGLFYWLTRIWFLATRGEMPDDPVSFAIRDARSLIVGFTCMLVLLLAMYMPVELLALGDGSIGSFLSVR